MTPPDLIFGLNNDRKDQKSSEIVIVTILFAKYYSYTNKFAPKELCLDEFKAIIGWRYDFEKPLSSSFHQLVRENST